MKTKLPQIGTVGKVLKTTTGATVGARIGVNLLDPNGNVVTSSIWNSILNPKAQAISFSGTSDDVPEGAYNLYFTNQRAQDAVGSIVNDTANITITYDGLAHTIESDLTDTGVVPGTYGDSAHSASITVDIKGRVISATQYPVSGGSEILVADGISAPPIMLTNEAEDDFLYSD